MVVFKMLFESVKKQNGEQERNCATKNDGWTEKEHDTVDSKKT